MRLQNSVVLVTRPDADAQRFVERLTQVAGPFDAVISPAFTYERCAADVPEFETAIFTSKTGVAFAPSGNGRRAYCVGDATAQAAKGAGYDTVNANGSAEDLIELILRQYPSDALSHLRGEVSQGDVIGKLQSAGLNCRDVVLYRKSHLAPTEEAVGLDTGERIVIVPLFSAETVSILAGWPMSFTGCVVVAISEFVGQAAGVLNPGHISISDAPNMEAMALATGRMIA